MSNTTDEAEGRRTRPFADFLADHNRGAGHREAGELLQELVGAVLDTGKKGSVTLTVSVEPMKGTADTLLTTVKVTSKIPQEPEKAAVFYADDERNLVRNDPNQLQFDSLKEVAGPVVKDPNFLRDGAGVHTTTAGGTA